MLRTDFIAIFSGFVTCMFVSSVNFRSVQVAQSVMHGFCQSVFIVSGSSTSSMFIFRGNSRTFRVSAVLLKGSKTGFVSIFSYFFGSSTSSMFIFRGNSHTFRCSPMLLTGVVYIRTRADLRILALQHGAQELKSMFPGNFRTFGCSATSRPKNCSHIDCSHM